jgi:cbb3-type cytochrome oxidase subunit 3
MVNGDNQGMTTTRFDPRFESPAQLAVVGVAVWIVAALIPFLHAFITVGIILLLVAGVGQLLRPRKRTMYWRERRIELEDSPRIGSGLYRAIFRA